MATLYRLPWLGFKLIAAYDIVNDESDCQLIYTHHTGEQIKLDVDPQYDMKTQAYHEKVLLPAVDAIRRTETYQRLNTALADA